MARIELTTLIAAPPERCFDLARSVDFHLKSTAATGEKAVAGKVSGLLDLGDEVTWRARHFGVWQHLTSRITAFNRPGHFRDSMVRGAFRSFDHDHFFTEIHAGRTEMRDVLVYQAPLGLLGRLVERQILTRYLTRFLGERNRMIKEIAESGYDARSL
jgi:ligand-binding SRPBCC domain-containing protein